jgi:hypothetical protein
MAFRRAAVAALLLVLSACAQTFDATALGVPVTMARPAGEAPQGERFRVNSTSLYAAWGLLTLTQASLQKSVAHQLVGGRQVTDLKIRVRSKWTDLLITGLTLGLFVPRTVTFEGVVTGGAAPADTTR